MKAVYITGCLGFIGSYITRECLKKGWYVRGIDKGTYAANMGLLKEFNNSTSVFIELKGGAGRTCMAGRNPKFPG
jgi:nucleoside-diphosphate-sugar epimerase